MTDLYGLADEKMAKLSRFFLKSHGKPRVGDRSALSGIIFINRNGLRWREAPAAYGPQKTLYSRPSLKGRKVPIPHDAERYKRRHKIENSFARLKDWRRVATRDDRCPNVFLSACALAAGVMFCLWILTLA